MSASAMVAVLSSPCIWDQASTPTSPSPNDTMRRGPPLGAFAHPLARQRRAAVEDGIEDSPVGLRTEASLVEPAYERGLMECAQLRGEFRHRLGSAKLVFDRGDAGGDP